MQPIRHAVDMLLVPAPANLAYAVFLAMLATATLRRKRVSWWILTVYFGFSAVFSVLFVVVVSLVPKSEVVDDAGNALFDTYDTVLLWVSIGVSVAALVVLALTKAEFYAKVRRGSSWRGLGVLAVLLAIGIGLSCALLLASPARCPAPSTGSVTRPSTCWAARSPSTSRAQAPPPAGST